MHPSEVGRLVRDVRAPWYVAAGWALDLHRGLQSRPHEDLEIGVPADAFGEIRAALGAFDFVCVGSGQGWPLDSPAFALTHQTWARDRLSGAYRLDVFREAHDGDLWVCRRDESIRLPYSQVIRRTADGLPYLTPELVLLFKARAARPKDDADLDGILPFLGPDSRSWLRSLVGQVHPGHRWLEAI